MADKDERDYEALSRRQLDCGYAQNGFPALCTCGTCNWVDEGTGCVWCDVGFTPTTGNHETAKGSFPCTNSSVKR